MATGSGAKSRRHGVDNGPSKFTEPPSSVLAAQLAPRLPAQGSREHSLHREAFSQLRQELLGNGEHSVFNLDENVTDARELICVVVKAGLDTRGNDNPFISRDDIAIQTQDCLDIVRVVLQKAPQALFENCEDPLGKNTAQAPLYAWLIPHLLSLLKIWSQDDVRDKIFSLFPVVCMAQHRCPRLWRSYTAIPIFMQACARDMLLDLEKSDLSKAENTSYLFPGSPETFVNSLDSLNLPRSVYKGRIQLGPFPDTTIVLLQLLGAVACSIPLEGLEESYVPLNGKNLAWALNSFQRVWTVALAWFKVQESIQRELQSALQLTKEFYSTGQKLFDYSSRLDRGSAWNRKAASVWIQISADILSLEKLYGDPELQRAITQMINDVTATARQSLSIASVVEEGLVSTIIQLKSKGNLPQSLSPSLQHCLTQVVERGYCKPPSPEQLPSSAIGAEEESSDDFVMVDADGFNDPDLGQIDPLDNRARKRPRITRPQDHQNESPSLVQVLVGDIYKILGSPNIKDLKALTGIASKYFPSLPPDEQTDVISRLGRIACAGAGTLAMFGQGDAQTLQARCTVCDSEKPGEQSGKAWESAQSADLCMTLIELIPKIQRSGSPRIVAMLALRNMLIHEADSAKVRLGSNPFGEWCLQSLRSSLRELRIAAGRTLTAFVAKGLDVDQRRSNFVVALEHLSSLFDKHDSSIQETCILSLCRVAEVSGDEEMNIILLRLVEYLGHTNPYISSVAYTGITKLAQNLSTTPAALFRPFWRTVSVTVVKSLQTRPHIAEQLCDLLGMKVDDLLRLTEVYILPYLVLMRKRDVIARIGNTHNPPLSPFKLCVGNNNLAAILSFLLVQPSPDHAGMISSLLADVSDEFKEHDAAGWVRAEPILIACDLLKGLADAGEGKELRFTQALHTLAKLTPRKSGSVHGSTRRKSDLVGNFIEEHVLGIITEFAHAVNDFHIRQPIIEKKRNIVGMGEMIKLAKGHISTALPQICACLRSALNMESLSDNAFATWGTLIECLDEADLEPLIDQTFAVIIKNWDAFQNSSKERACQLVDYLLKEHGEMIRDISSSLPSLSSIPVMAEFEALLNEMKGQLDMRSQFAAFVRRCQSENVAVVEQALKELAPLLRKQEEFIHRSVLNEQPDTVVAQLTRALLDSCVKFSSSSDAIVMLSAQCLGLIGCLDPNKIEIVKEKKDILVLTNFDRAEETFDFILFFLQHVLVEAFLSTSNTRSQGFLAYAMQNLLKLCNLDSTVTLRSRDTQYDGDLRRWSELPESVRNILTPFLTSKYTVTIGGISTNCEYPLFNPEKLNHAKWLRDFVLDLLQKGIGENVRLIFSVCSRIIRGQDISIASFLLPFAALNLAVGGTDEQRDALRKELTRVLEHPLPDGNSPQRETTILCSESVFHVLDYLSRWLQGKKKQYSSVASHGGCRTHKTALLEAYAAQSKNVEQLLSLIPAEVISKRAVECKSYSRALFHWEQYIRQCKASIKDEDLPELEPLYQRLQDIYMQIDEPDGIEGISAHLHVLDVDRQVLEHRKAGRWIAAQNWYELQLNKTPENGEIQLDLLRCLRESGQHDVLLNQFEGLKTTKTSLPRVLPFAIEASWVTGKWNRMDKYLKMCSDQITGDFNVGIGAALSALRRGNTDMFRNTISTLRGNIASGLTTNSTTSLQSCHDSVLKLHALTEIESIADGGSGNNNRAGLLENLDRRLEILGGHLSEKQYLLGLRRATMELSNKFQDSDIASVWLVGARLARKANSTSQAFNAVIHAAQLKDKSATIEHARLQWKEGHHRKAIQILEGAIAANAFQSHNYAPLEDAANSVAPDLQQQQNMLTARAHLLLAKWMDRAGQTQSNVVIQRYRDAITFHTRWEKAYYYLGKHYNKILDSEKAKPLGKEAQIYLSGEAAKLVIENYLRSLAYGNKYVFQTLPKILTLWLEHAAVVDQPFDPRHGDNEEFQNHSMTQRRRSLDDMHSQLRKYISRIPPSLLFTIYPQVVARICHPNSTVYNILTAIVVKIVTTFPQQGLWTVLAIVKSSSRDRASRGISCLHKITEAAKKTKMESSATEIKAMINQGQRLSDELLKLCVARIEDKASKVSLARNLGFNHKVVPCRLVIPLEATLTPSLPTNHDPGYLKTFRPFPKDTVTIEGILDEALVLNSLQKPRKITLRGSDGKTYSLLCKPKDDLRKDQRLMEFNGMINRFLKRDVESSKRRMYIKTYAVTPLNEECGLIEWVDNLRTLRELVIKLLKERGIMPNYNEIRQHLSDACSSSSKLPIFTNKILTKLPPVLHEWFVEMFPEPGAWFAARLRYTRSCAVMSMVGYALGLGDRHGENILFEEGTGGVLHVDFNCLFDKGLTFEKPELVPFRLTHNMVDAFGAYGFNGPFRKTCELSLGLLRQNEDALMTILETFLHDPTTDFIGKKRRTNTNVPDTPEGVLESVRNKLRGLLPGESVPLSVGGHVDELILQATDKKNLAAMYVGWCAFF